MRHGRQDGNTAVSARAYRGLSSRRRPPKAFAFELRQLRWRTPRQLCRPGLRRQRLGTQRYEVPRAKCPRRSPPVTSTPCTPAGRKRLSCRCPPLQNTVRAGKVARYSGEIGTTVKTKGSAVASNASPDSRKNSRIRASWTVSCTATSAPVLRLFVSRRTCGNAGTGACLALCGAWEHFTQRRAPAAGSRCIAGAGHAHHRQCRPGRFAQPRPDDHDGVVVDNSSPMRSGCRGAQFPADRPLAPTSARSSDHPVWTAPHQPASAIAAASRNTRLCTRSSQEFCRARPFFAARIRAGRACRPGVRVPGHLPTTLRLASFYSA